LDGNCYQSTAEHIPETLESGFCVRLNYSCKYGYTSGLKTGTAKFLADDTPGWVNCK